MCLLYAGVRAGEAVGSHIPPYSEGQCLSPAGVDQMVVRIKENHILGGYSIVEMKVAIFTQEGPVSFQELNETPFKKVDCVE